MSAQPESPRDQAEAWLARARDDLLSAETLLAYQDRGWSIVAFHAQQGAEKALKAVLVAHNLPVPKTHDLLLLAGRLPVSTHDVDVNDLKRLNPWVVGGRYPGDVPEASRDDAAELLKVRLHVPLFGLEGIGGES